MAVRLEHTSMTVLAAAAQKNEGQGTTEKRKILEEIRVNTRKEDAKRVNRKRRE